MENRDFLPKDKNKPIWQKDFTVAYLSVAVIASIALIIANFLLYPYVAFCFPIIAGVFYIFYAVLSFGSKKLFIEKILGHELALSVCFLVVRLSLGGNGLGYELFLPVMFFLGELLATIYLLKHRKEFPKRFIDFALISLATVIPCALCFIFKFTLFIPSVVVTAVGVGALAVVVITNLRDVKTELKKYFHL